MRLSVVVPTHNTRELTLLAVGSILSQRESDLDVIVVDDASEDATAEAVSARWPEVRVLRCLPGVGFTAAANRGLDAAQGDLLLVLNSDTEVEPGALAALHRAFAQSGALGIAGAQLFYPDGRPQWSSGAEPTFLWFFALASGAGQALRPLRPLRKMRPGRHRRGPRGGTGGRAATWVTGAAMAMRRAVWRELGPFDLRFRFYAQDLDLCLRAGAAGWTVAVVGDFRVLHHHGASIRRTPGAAGMQQPQLLWADLLRWAEKRHGAGWARKAARALRAGGRVRLLALGASRLLLRGERRAEAGREIAAYTEALRAIETLPLTGEGR